MKHIIFASVLLVVIRTCNVFAELIPASVIDVLKDNVSTKLSSLSNAPPHYELCQRAFTNKLEPAELSELIAFGTANSSGGASDSFFWLTAMYASVLIQNGDLNHLIAQSSNTNRLRSLAALNVLSKVTPNAALSSFFYEEVVTYWNRTADNNTVDSWENLEVSIIAEGLANHDLGNELPMLGAFLENRILTQQMRLALFNSLIQTDKMSDTKDALLMRLLLQEDNIDSLSLMLDQARAAEYPELATRLRKHTDLKMTAINQSLNSIQP